MRAAETTSFRPRRLAHANLWVRDLEATADFYRTVLGMPEVYRRPAARAVFLSNGNTYHDVALMDSDRPAGPERPPGLNHLAFELESEVDLVAGYEAASGRGTSFDRTLSHDVAHSLYLTDPDGNGIEIYADVKRDWRTLRSGEILREEPPWLPGSSVPVDASCYPVNPEIDSVPDAIFHARRTAGATIVCRDYAAMVRFYTEEVGLRCRAGGPDEGRTSLSGTLGYTDLVLVRGAGNTPPGLHHVTFEVAEVPYEAFRRLESLGVEAPLFMERPDRTYAFVRDPSSVLLALYCDSDAVRGRSGVADEDLALFVA